MNNEMIPNITNLLLELGIPTNLLGFSYIVYIVKLALKNPDFNYRISKDLYIEVAQHFGTSHSSVERCIRHAIMTGWVCGNPERIEQIFKNSINPKKGVPTNSQFISSVCLYSSRKASQQEQ